METVENKENSKKIRSTEVGWKKLRSTQVEVAEVDGYGTSHEESEECARNSRWMGGLPPSLL